MLFLCGTFFPLSSLPSAAQGLAMALLPLTHLVNLTRGSMAGSVEPVLGLDTGLLLAISILWLVAVTIFFFILSINLMKKRLTG
jgi:lipooligosaccharide transport system permease protein